ncbi:SulP family sulfate permease [Candidatus Pelagibacter ubique]|uniref:SulP family sulfate permease n=1 Tax=Pelagibacter ubique TaxID=198252 RepID=A0ABX1SZG9_PELUQ|nr:SulP family inorganic anion transporter [Candidatus Pelagibacter ubique]NMN67243.1 SulP family sulfate permease [Candidatus Pelagibacter ubique]
MKKTRHADALLAFVKSIRVTTQNYIPKEKASFSLFRIEILSGLTVALALVPEAIAFAFVAGVAPLSGLYAAFIVGLITALLGGRPGMISGATGALAVVMVALVMDHGTQYLFATVVLMGILQLIAGVFKLGKFIRMVPEPVMLGFVNGLAIVIAISQLGQFKTINTFGQSVWITGDTLLYSIIFVAFTMFIIWFLPKITKALPSTLVAILFTTILVLILKIDIPNVGDLASVKGGLPNFSIPSVSLNIETLKIIFPYAFILASIGLIESLLTLNLVGEITNKRGGASQECLAQGLANTVTGFFGGMGGCAMIGQSMINVRSGGRTRIAGIAAAVFLLIFILYTSTFIEMIPIAALVGVMFMVVIGTFAWNSLKILFFVPRSDALVTVLVTVVTVLEDLAVAVVVGVIVSALVFAWKSASKIRATERPSKTEKGAKVYEIEGPLFFSSTNSFLELFNPSEDPDIIIIDFVRSKVIDQSALKAIEDIADKYNSFGKKVKLRHLTKDCHKLLSRSGQLVVDSDDDPDYGVAVDYGVKLGIFGK